MKNEKNIDCWLGHEPEVCPMTTETWEHKLWGGGSRLKAKGLKPV